MKEIKVINIKDNKIEFILDGATHIEELYFDNDDIIFDDNIKAEITSNINPITDSTYFSDLMIDSQLYVLKSDTKNIYSQTNQNNELKVAGEFKIKITKCYFKPKRTIKNFDNQKISNLVFPGFKFDYSFENDFAKPSNFYLAISPSNEFNISSQKVQKDLKHLFEILSQAGILYDDIEKYQNATLNLNNESIKVLSDLEYELNNKLAKNNVSGYIKAFFDKNTNHLIKYYAGNKDGLKVSLNLESKNTNSSSVSRGMSKSLKSVESVKLVKDKEEILDYDEALGYDDDYSQFELGE